MEELKSVIFLFVYATSCLRAVTSNRNHLILLTSRQNNHLAVADRTAYSAPTVLGRTSCEEEARVLRQFPEAHPERFSSRTWSDSSTTGSYLASIAVAQKLPHAFWTSRRVQRSDIAYIDRTNDAHDSWHCEMD